ncbi:MAG: hypothetical protein HY308_04960 [Gammaproteobacteria bacterium]|nr:hypothetical protein [Gammaproteobacteria bacterium]
MEHNNRLARLRRNSARAWHRTLADTVAFVREAKYRLGIGTIVLVYVIAMEVNARWAADGFDVYDQIYYYTDFNRDFQQLQVNYGLTFAIDIKETDYPDSWAIEPVAKVSPLENDVGLSQMIHALSLSLKKYPADLIRKELKGLVFLEKLTTDGIHTAGTYTSTQRIVIVRTGDGIADSVEQLQETFHHEFSSLLKNSYNFSEQDWQRASGKNFSYQLENDPYSFVSKLTEYPADETLYQRGLVEFYGETGLENDFNTYAQVIFTHPQQMRVLIRQYPVIRDKYAVFKRFYLSIDKRLAPVFAKID